MSDVGRWIEAQIDRSPSAVAVTYEGASTTYAELDARANRLAHHLIAGGATRDTPIGVRLERSLDLIVTLLAIWKAGAPYLPIDPAYPGPRVDAMLADGGCALVIDRAWLDAHRAEIARAPATRPRVTLDGDHAAYVIFTSGSTGRPKGAILTHAGLANRLRWMQDTFALDAGDVVLHKTPFTFDVSVWELFWPLMTGARLVIARPDGHRDASYLARLIERERVTTVHFVPSMLGPFLAVADATRCASLRRVICSGEALTASLVRACGRTLDAELHNLYGPTEATIDVSWWRCDPGGESTTVPIGAPIANTRLYVLDAAGRPAAPGQDGELYIAGVQLARAYSRRPDLTAERFVPDPFHAGERMYRTGDVARLRPDGAIEYLGRVDHQIKLRGHRIELAEIEVTIAALAEIRDAVVVAREDTPGDQRLVAYVTARDPSAPPSELRIREHVRAHLPDYMVPGAVVVLDAFPTTANGKLDRAALPAPAAAPAMDDAPRSELEAWIAATWCELLRVDRVALDQNFFAAGGHSLLLTQLGIRIERELGVTVELRSLFDAPTVRGVTAAVEAELARVERLLDEIEAMSPEEAAALLAQETE